MKRELLAAIATVDDRVGRVEANTLDISEKVDLLCKKLLAPGERQAFKRAAAGGR